MGWNVGEVFDSLGLHPQARVALIKDQNAQGRTPQLRPMPWEEFIYILSHGVRFTVGVDS